MELKVYWTDFSKKVLKLIYKYYKNKVNKRVAEKVVLEIVEKTTILETHPKIGQVEELLNDRKQEFRYLVQKNHKIIYWINESKDRIEIIDIFDSRQNPIKIKQNK